MLVFLEPKILRVLYDKHNLWHNQDNIVVYNLNANIDYIYYLPYARLTINIPPLKNVTDWDLAILDAVMNIDSNFGNFIQIPLALAEGKDVYVLVYREQTIFDSINEIIAKFIQCRYGYNYQLLADEIDFNPNDESRFTTDGIQQLDEDVKRYVALGGYL